MEKFYYIFPQNLEMMIKQKTFVPELTRENFNIDLARVVESMLKDFFNFN